MTHPRTQIRAAFVDRLTDATDAEELIAPERTTELLAYDRPAPAGLGE